MKIERETVIINTHGETVSQLAVTGSEQAYNRYLARQKLIADCEYPTKASDCIQPELYEFGYPDFSE